MLHTSGIISSAMELATAFPTKKILNPSPRKIVKTITTRQGMSWRGSLHGSNAGLEELQSDTKGIARTISDSCIWHQLLCIGGL